MSGLVNLPLPCPVYGCLTRSGLAIPAPTIQRKTTTPLRKLLNSKWIDVIDTRCKAKWGVQPETRVLKCCTRRRERKDACLRKKPKDPSRRRIYLPRGSRRGYPDKRVSCWVVEHIAQVGTFRPENQTTVCHMTAGS